jgi:hypothetical protein
MGFTVSFQEAKKKFIAVVKELKLKLKTKMSLGPVTAMAARTEAQRRQAPPGLQRRLILGHCIKTRSQHNLLHENKLSVPESSRNLNCS